MVLRIKKYLIFFLPFFFFLNLHNVLHTSHVMDVYVGINRWFIYTLYNIYIHIFFYLVAPILSVVTQKASWKTFFASFATRHLTAQHVKSKTIFFVVVRSGLDKKKKKSKLGSHVKVKKRNKIATLEVEKQNRVWKLKTILRVLLSVCLYTWRER